MSYRTKLGICKGRENTQADLEEDQRYLMDCPKGHLEIHPEVNGYCKFDDRK